MFQRQHLQKGGRGKTKRRKDHSSFGLLPQMAATTRIKARNLKLHLGAKGSSTQTIFRSFPSMSVGTWTRSRTGRTETISRGTYRMLVSQMVASPHWIFLQQSEWLFHFPNFIQISMTIFFVRTSSLVLFEILKSCDCVLFLSFSCLPTVFFFNRGFAQQINIITQN